MIKMTQHTPNFPPPSIIPKTSKAMKLLDIDPLELARQLTIMESKLFAKIRPMECLNRGRDGKPGDTDDNISSIIDTSNKVSFKSAIGEMFRSYVSLRSRNGLLMLSSARTTRENELRL